MSHAYRSWWRSRSWCAWFETNGRWESKRNVVRCSNQKRTSKKGKTVYVCDQCGEDYAQWLGQCPSCKSFGSLHGMRLEKEEQKVSNRGGGAAAMAVGWVRGQDAPESLSDLLHRDQEGRISQASLKYASRLRLQGITGKEIERVLGGGIMPGSLVLVGGDPGVGKSTLMLQVAGMLVDAVSKDRQNTTEETIVPADVPGKVLYVSGEESAHQLAGRAARLGINSSQLYVYSATKLDAVLQAMEELRPVAAIVDSIQTVYLEAATGGAGTVSQVRECATALLHASKHTGTSTFLVGHVTKSGDIAGPKVLEHIVDVVLYVEGDKVQCHRLLRGVKNRFGPVEEVGIFEMKEEGLVAVENPSSLFLRETGISNGVSSAVTINLEGTRPILMEVQALCSPCAQGQGPRRTSSGIPGGRLHLLLAILSKHAKVPTFDQDVFVNVVGGVSLNEPASDLAVAVAIASSFLEKPIKSGTAFAGEVGLGGELRGIGQAGRRIAEAKKLGFQRVIVPTTAEAFVEGIEVIRCGHLRDVFQLCMKGGRG